MHRIHLDASTSYAKTTKSKMKINQLPVELLMKIFNYFRNFKKVSLVCHKFYEVASETNDKNITLYLNKNLLADKNLPLLHSIESTSRRIWKVEAFFADLTEEETQTLIGIISKFSTHIKYFQLRGYGIAMSDILNIFSMVPNVRHLDIRGIYVENGSEETLSKEDLNFNHLKILELFDCEPYFLPVFIKLPEGVLTELTLQRYPVHLLDELLNRQKNIKKLRLDNCYLTPHSLDSLQLDSLQLWETKVDTAALSRQTKLKYLRLDKGHSVDEHLMMVITNRLIELEGIEFDVTTPVNEFVNIGQLKKLKHLTLWLCCRSHQSGIFDAFIYLDNSRLDTLTIKRFMDLTIDRIQALATSAPKLKTLKFSALLSWQEITGILKFFNFVEHLRVGGLLDSQNYGIYKDYLDQSDSFNANLIELDFYIGHRRSLHDTFTSIKLIEKMIGDYPNLKKLKIKETNESLTSLKFRLIVDGFAKLESLEVYGTGVMNIDDFKYLRDHKNKLQVVSFTYVKNCFVAQHIAELKAIFEEVKVYKINSYHNGFNIKL